MVTLNTAYLLNPQGADPNASKTKTPTIRIFGEGSTNGVYQCYVDAKDAGQWRGNMLSQVDVTTPELADGSHKFEFIELAPNYKIGTPYMFTVDTGPPGVPVITNAVAVGPDANGKYQIQADGTAPGDGRSVKLYNGSRLLGGSTVTNGKWHVATIQQASGAYSLTAKVIDWAGNESLQSTPWPLTVGIVVPPQPTVPGAGYAPAAVVALGLRTVTLAWSAPADGGSPITGYILRRSGATIFASTGVQSFTDTIPGTGTYTYTVSAVNAVGEGPQSPAVTV